MESGKIKYVIPLFIIPILIANLHVAVWPFYFVLFLPYICEYLIECIIDVVLYNKIQKFILEIRIRYLKKAKNLKNVDDKLAKAMEDLQKNKEKVSMVKIRREQNQKNAYKIQMVKNKNVKFLILVMIICIFTGLLTPLGDTPYTYLYKTMIGNTVKNINEHLPLTLINSQEAICILILFLAILMF